MSDRQIQTPPVEYVSSLKAGEHGCIFFTSLTEMRKIHFAFVKSGLEDNWGVVYATPAESFDDLKDSMEKHGIDVQKYQELGDLILVRGEDLYKSGEKPDLENCKTAVKSVIEGFMAKGRRE